jgi:hypothetical protein
MQGLSVVSDGADGAFRSAWARQLAVVWLAVAAGLLCAGGVASASAPDGRAWEMVSPLDKNGGSVLGIAKASAGGVVQSSADGQKVTYVSLGSFGDLQGAPYGSQYVSTREAGAGWSAENISTPMSNQAYEIVGGGAPYRAFSLDLSAGMVSGGNNRSPSGVQSPPLAGAPAGYENYYLYGIPGGALQPLLTAAPSVAPGEFGLEFLGDTPDLSHAVVSSSAALGEAGSAPGLYEWEQATVPGERPAGRFQPVSVLPNGVPEPDGRLGGGGGSTEHAISEDGSKVIWTQNGVALFVREGIGTPQARTVQADAPLGQGRYLTADSSGSRIFFADNETLTGESSRGDLYMFEPEAGEAGRLVDLTVDHVDAEGAGVLGALGASADGSYLYFVANGVLSSAANAQGETATLGNCSRGLSSPGSVCNLYLWHDGWEKPRFIATLSGSDGGINEGGALGVAFDWSSALGLRTVRVSRDGTRVVFMSARGGLRSANFPGGYDNTVAGGGSCGTDSHENPLPALCEEIFLYEATTNRLSCVSCDPSGARPTGPSGILGGTEFANNKATYQSRVLSEGEDAGRVFFDSADGLVAQDTNGVEDVYEYENVHVYILSGGRSLRGASFVDASINGNDAFFITDAQLAGQDTDRQVDLYDARAPHEPGEAVGFPSAPIMACEGEDCLAPGSAVPGFAVPSSPVLGGPGNVAAGPTRVAKPKAKPKKPRTKPKPKRRRRKHRTRAGRVRSVRTGPARSATAAGTTARGGR